MRSCAIWMALSLAVCADAAVVKRDASRRDLKEMVAASDAIVHGRVVRHWSAWDASRQTIWTHYVLEPFEVLRGGTRAAWTISEPGGIVGDIGMDVSGSVPFADGEEVVVLMRRMPNSAMRVSGSGAGKYTVANGPGGKRTRSAAAEGPELGQLKAAIRAAVKAAEGVR